MNNESAAGSSKSVKYPETFASPTKEELKQMLAEALAGKGHCFAP